jgi:hypothetical protein
MYATCPSVWPGVANIRYYGLGWGLPPIIRAAAPEHLLQKHVSLTTREDPVWRSFVRTKARPGTVMDTHAKLALQKSCSGRMVIVPMSQQDGSQPIRCDADYPQTLKKVLGAGIHTDIHGISSCLIGNEIGTGKIRRPAKTSHTVRDRDDLMASLVTSPTHLSGSFPHLLIPPSPHARTSPRYPDSECFTNAPSARSRPFRFTPPNFAKKYVTRAQKYP